MKIVMLLFLYLLVFVSGEVLYRNKVPLYITRKVVHIGSGALTALLPFFVELNVAVLFGIFVSVILFITKKSRLLDSIHKSENASLGSILFAPGLTLAAIFFWPVEIVIFQVSVLILALSDGFAGIVGRKFGRKYYSITGRKSYEGSLCFFLISFVLLLVMIGNSSLLQLILVPLILTGVEATLSKGWDNLILPLIAGILVYLII